MHSPDNAPWSGATRLRVLHLEDNQHDRELVRDALTAEGIGCELVYAKSSDEFAAALADGKFDLILSDFTMPGYDGESALALVRAKYPEVPYVFVSGTIGEERAIESLKNGATDYVLKHHLERLIPAVRRALREANERARRKEAEGALRRAEARFRGIFENAVEGIYQSTRDGRLIEANRTLARLCGYDNPAELCAAVRDLERDLYVLPGQRREFVRLLDAHGEVLGYESQIKRPDGRTFWILENARVVRDAGGNLLYYEGMVTDVTARKLAEAALQQSEERFRVMAESIDDVFWISSADHHRLFYVNPAYAEVWGHAVEEFHAAPDQWFNAVIPEDQEKVARARADLTAGQDFRLEYRIRRGDGSLRWIEGRGYPIRGGSEITRIVCVAMDVTARKHLESQLLQAQKMESIGQLAGGVAHDFNNVLTIVTGYARLLLDGGRLPAEFVDPLTQIYTAGVRATNLTRQLLVFSRKQAAHPRVLDLHELVEEVGALLRRLIGEHIRLKLVKAGEPCRVEADPGMLEQVLMNFAVNARDAMPGGGTLEITTEALHIADPQLRGQPQARAGDFIVLTARDTGCGIPPENIARIFEPFFTTKPVGQGTGLGLATVFGIVQQHQGWIEVESAVGAGTAFRVLLPRAVHEVTASSRASGSTPAVRGGSETVLLVEDEAPVREFGVAVLRSHGYRVLQAESGVHAMEVWQWHQSRIALLISDLVMPEGLGGVELAARLRRDKPTLHVILTSGYANEALEDAFRPPAGTQFIHKPYKPQVLAQTVRNALDGNYNR